jgi:hypothetical protein
MVLETAVNGRAAAVVTHNVNDFRPATTQFGVRTTDTSRVFEGAIEMNKSTYPLKLPNSVKNAAAELARIDGVSLNQFIAAAVAEKVGALRTAGEFLQQRAGSARPKDLIKLNTFGVHPRSIQSREMNGTNYFSDFDVQETPGASWNSHSSAGIPLGVSARSDAANG